MLVANEGPGWNPREQARGGESGSKLPHSKAGCARKKKIVAVFVARAFPRWCVGILPARRAGAGRSRDSGQDARATTAKSLGGAARVGRAACSRVNEMGKGQNVS
ncbi:MAG: hypothetical protein ACLQVG_11800 [Terriglobia bacterium]